MSGHDSLRYHGPPRHSPPEPAPPDPSHQQGLSKASTMPGPGSHTSLEELSCRNSSTNCSRMGNSRSEIRTDVAVHMATFESRTLSDHSELLCCRLNHQCFCHNFVEFWILESSNFGLLVTAAACRRPFLWVDQCLNYCYNAALSLLCLSSATSKHFKWCFKCWSPFCLFKLFLHKTFNFPLSTRDVA